MNRTLRRHRTLSKVAALRRLAEQRAQASSMAAEGCCRQKRERFEDESRKLGRIVNQWEDLLANRQFVPELASQWGQALLGQHGLCEQAKEVVEDAEIKLENAQGSLRRATADRECAERLQHAAARRLIGLREERALAELMESIGFKWKSGSSVVGMPE